MARGRSAWLFDFLGGVLEYQKRVGIRSLRSRTDRYHLLPRDCNQGSECAYSSSETCPSGAHWR